MSKKLALCELIKRANIIHNDKYKYTLYKYINTTTPSFIICKIHGKFLQSFNDHIHKKAGCPKCAIENRKIRKSLLEFPKLLEEWDYDKNIKPPCKVSYGSQKKFWWKCKNGHSWQAMVRNRTIYNHGCPKCVKGKSFLETHAFLCKEWDFKKNEINPKDLTFGSEVKVWWLCKNNHSWVESVRNRTSGYNCPYCSGKRACDDNCLKTLRPDLLKEWSPKNKISPKDVTVGSNKKIWWVCKYNHEWKASIDSRTHLGRGCPYCSGNKVSDKNSLTSVRPNLIKEWSEKNNIKPDEVSYGSRKKFLWVCENGHEWYATPNNRSNGYGCPLCSKRISRKSQKWLDFLQIPEENREKYININGKRYFLDALKGKTVYEFYGDFWHGNPKTYNNNDINPIVKKTFGELYFETLKKEEELLKEGYVIVFIWEKDWSSQT